MVRSVLALLLVVMVGCGAARTGTTNAGEIELIITDAKGFPLSGVAVFAAGRAWMASGMIRFSNVTKPLVIVAYKPGYAPSYPRAFPPGPQEIRLYRVGFAN